MRPINNYSICLCFCLLFWSPLLRPAHKYQISCFTFSPSVQGKEGADTYFPLTGAPAGSPCWDHIAFLWLIRGSVFFAVQEPPAPAAFTAVAKAVRRTLWPVLHPSKLNICICHIFFLPRARSLATSEALERLESHRMDKRDACSAPGAI